MKNIIRNKVLAKFLSFLVMISIIMGNVYFEDMTIKAETMFTVTEYFISEDNVADTTYNRREIKEPITSSYADLTILDQTKEYRVIEGYLPKGQTTKKEGLGATPSLGISEATKVRVNKNMVIHWYYSHIENDSTKSVGDFINVSTQKTMALTDNETWYDTRSTFLFYPYAKDTLSSIFYSSITVTPTRDVGSGEQEAIFNRYYLPTSGEFYIQEMYPPRLLPIGGATSGKLDISTWYSTEVNYLKNDPDWYANGTPYAMPNSYTKNTPTDLKDVKSVEVRAKTTDAIASGEKTGNIIYVDTTLKADMDKMTDDYKNGIKPFKAGAENSNFALLGDKVFDAGIDMKTYDDSYWEIYMSNPVINATVKVVEDSSLNPIDTEKTPQKYKQLFESSNAKYPSEVSDLTNFKVSIYDNKNKELKSSLAQTQGKVSFDQITTLNDIKFAVNANGFDVVFLDKEFNELKQGKSVILGDVSDIDRQMEVYGTGIANGKPILWVKNSRNLDAKFGVQANILLIKKTIPEYSAFFLSDYQHTTNMPQTISELLEGQKITKPANPELQNHKFVGWYKDQQLTDGNSWDFETDSVLQSDVTLYAKFKQFRSVDFDSKGGTVVSPQTNKVEGDFVSIPTPPIKDNNLFGGWYKDEDYLEEWDFETDKMQDTNITLYAKWNYVVTTYRAIFDAQGATPVPNTVEGLVSGQRVIEPQEIPVLDSNHRFVGWFKDLEFTQKWIFTGDNADKIIDSDVTLYAKFIQLLKFSVDFNSKGGTAVKAQHDKSENDYIKRPIDPSKEDSVFINWYKDENYLEVWDFVEDKMPARDITIYAKWEDVIPNTYTAFFETFGGNITPPQTGLVASDIVVKPAKNPKKIGYNFDGWFVDESCTQPWDFSSNNIEQSNVSIYAKWVPEQTFTANFNVNGGTEVLPQTGLYEGEKVTKPTPNPSKEDFHFDGWYKDESYLETWDFDVDVMPEGDINLHAKWIPIFYKAFFETYGGSYVPHVEKLAKGDLVPRPLGTTKVDNVFGGWYKDSSYMKRWDFNTDVMPAENVTIHAKWALKQTEMPVETPDEEETFEDNGEERLETYSPEMPVPFLEDDTIETEKSTPSETPTPSPTATPSLEAEDDENEIEEEQAEEPDRAEGPDGAEDQALQLSPNNGEEQQEPSVQVIIQNNVVYRVMAVENKPNEFIVFNEKGIELGIVTVPEGKTINDINIAENIMPFEGGKLNPKTEDRQRVFIIIPLVILLGVLIKIY